MCTQLWFLCYFTLHLVFIFKPFLFCILFDRSFCFLLFYYFHCNEPVLVLVWNMSLTCTTGLPDADIVAAVISYLSLGAYSVMFWGIVSCIEVMSTCGWMTQFGLIYFLFLHLCLFFYAYCVALIFFFFSDCYRQFFTCTLTYIHIS